MPKIKIPYPKTVKTDMEHVALLSARGLLIDDEERALRYLRQIGYFRLSGYLAAFEKGIQRSGARDHTILPGTTFDQVLDLYVFDRKLRLLIMEALERVEVALRSAWANSLAREKDEQQGLHPDAHAWLDPRRTDGSVDSLSLMTNGAKKLNDSQESFAVHYRGTYDSPRFPPIWALVETLSFGELSRWLEHTASLDVKRAVSEALGLPNQQVAHRVVEALSSIRNVCAHHNRCWDRVHAKGLPTLNRLHDDIVVFTTHGKNGELVNAPDKHLYNYLVVLAFILNHLNPKSTWRARLVALVAERTPDQLKRMAFPADWHQRNVWVNPPREPAAVSGLEASLRDALRRHAAAEGVTVADAHAALLRAALLPVTTA
ncbi:Abi family protein [Myxococcota bacterium]|nr:Abi family protein [Myxococcota bacterium]